jgi:hypothetical protein
MPNRYMILTATTSMPLDCWGRYRRLAVVEVEAGFSGAPSMISPRARGVVRVVKTWEKLHYGKTERSAYGRAHAEAEALIATLTGA